MMMIFLNKIFFAKHSLKIYYQGCNFFFFFFSQLTYQASDKQELQAEWDNLPIVVSDSIQNSYQPTGPVLRKVTSLMQNLPTTGLQSGT